MKKFFTFCLVALPLMFLAACSDEDDLPKVDMSITVSNAQQIDGVIYVVQGDAFTISAINVVNQEAGKAAAVTQATYYWDFYRLGTSLVPPYGFTIQTTKADGDVAGTPLGRHELQIECPLIAVDKEVANAVLVYQVEVVANASDIPAGPAQNTFIVTPAIKK